MTQNITYAIAIEHAIDAVMHHCADDAIKNSVIKRLDALKNFELNMGVLSLAMCNIRADAINATQAIRNEKTIPEDVLNKLKQIEKTADSLHNVGGFMASGIACDAAYLLHHGVDDRWPTGLTEIECSIFSPSNNAAPIQEYRTKFELSSDEIQKIKTALASDVDPVICRDSSNHSSDNQRILLELKANTLQRIELLLQKYIHEELVKNSTTMSNFSES
jgi:hypothetical protein